MHSKLEEMFSLGIYVSNFCVCCVMHLELILLCGMRWRLKLVLKSTHLERWLRALIPLAQNLGSVLSSHMATHSHL